MLLQGGRYPENMRYSIHFQGKRPRGSALLHQKRRFAPLFRRFSCGRRSRSRLVRMGDALVPSRRLCQPQRQPTTGHHKGRGCRYSRRAQLRASGAIKGPCPKRRASHRGLARLSVPLSREVGVQNGTGGFVEEAAVVVVNEGAHGGMIGAEKRPGGQARGYAKFSIPCMGASALPPTARLCLPVRGTRVVARYAAKENVGLARIPASA